ncbi:MAG: ABC transporter permease [Gemmatimonadota bacterium]|nr:MAG: ABC transporter permease [Gemmatimonadota bacterium]
MSWYRRLLNLMRSDRVARDIEREMEFHLAERTDELVARGMSEAEARREARRRFGHRPALKERVYKIDVLAWLDSLLADLRYAARALRANRRFTLVAALMLALGIGASTAIFSAVHGVLLRPLPYDDASRLVYVGTSWSSPQPTYTSVPDFIDWKERIRAVEGLAAATNIGFVLAEGGEPERIQAARVSPDFFTTLAVAPAIGRSFSAEEHLTGAEPVVILSHGLWQRRWGGDRTIIGATVAAEESRTGRGSFRVIGVLPSGFQGPAAMQLQDTEIWMPLPVDGAAYARSRTSRSLRVVGRLRPGADIEAARQEINAVAAAMAAEYPSAYTSSDGTLGIGVAPLLEMTIGSTSRELLILLAASALLLLIACANVANLLFARATERDKEVAVRSALGATRGRIVFQLLTESVSLALLGGTGGILVALSAVEVFRVIGPADFPRRAAVAIDPVALAFALGLTLVTAALFGLTPALLGSKSDLSRALKERSGTSSGTAGRARLRGILVAAETALSLIVLAGAGLLINSYFRLQSVDPGFDAENVLTMEVGLGKSYSTDDQRAAFYRELTDRVAAIPAVASVGSIVDPPMGSVMWAPPVYVEGRGVEEPPWVPAHMVGPGYFEALEIRLLRGRSITSHDVAGQPLVAIVNETMGKEFWPGIDPVGRSFTMSSRPGAPSLTVIGMVNDIRQVNLASPTQSEFYIPYAQHAWFGWNHIVLRTDADRAVMVGPMRQALADVDPTVPFDGVIAMSDRVSTSLLAPRFRTILLAGFAIVALLLASGGMYATMLYAVGQRTHEIGIRIALGGDAPTVLSLVLRQGMKVAALGIVAGLVTTLATARALESFVFGIEPTDPVTLGIIAAVVAIAALLACYFPARRATRIDPLVALHDQ